ncbi:MAG: hypothetical protein R8M38_01695 [Mariprofundaceae bacterium]
MKRIHDSRTMDLFAVPVPVSGLPGAMNMDVQIRHLLSDAIKAAPINRHQVAAKMSEYLGLDISKVQLDAWTAESKEAWRFPIAYLPAFETACDTYLITTYLAEFRGCGLAIGDEVLEARLGKLEKEQAEKQRQIKALKKKLEASNA